MLLLGLALALALAADPAPMSGGAHPEPATEAQIAIAREDLIIDIDFRHADVEATLLLENRGPATKLQVGFPCDLKLDDPMTSLLCKTRIVVTADKKPLTTKLKKTSKTEGHFVWPMSFASGQKVALVVRYRAPLYNERYGVPLFGMGTFFYRLKTGARWAGPIGRLEMRVRLPLDGIVHIAPPGYTRKPGEISWSLTDHEPADDLAITINNMLSGTELRAYGAKSAKAVAENRARGAYRGADLIRVADALESNGGGGSGKDFARWFHEVVRAKVGLRAPTDEEVSTTVRESARLLRETAARAKPQATTK